MFHNETFMKRRCRNTHGGTAQVLENTGQGAADWLGTPFALLMAYSRQRNIER
jgi:hypothetical protein